jgi:hypothetical protein
MTAVETAIAQENPLSIRSALLWGAQMLSRVGIENHRLDAEVLLRHVLDMEKEQLYLNADAPISADKKRSFGNYCCGARGASRLPILPGTRNSGRWILLLLPLC